MRLSLSIIMTAFVLAGCATSTTVPPSQNPSLQAVSPNTAAAFQGGAMQRSLDTWLKEEWNPITKNVPTVTTTKSTDGTVITTKTEATQITTTKTTSDGKVITTTEAIKVDVEGKTPFTLQKYADKWKVYHENEAKMKEGKPKEASHIETLQNMPVIGQ